MMKLAEETPVFVYINSVNHLNGGSYLVALEANGQMWKTDQRYDENTHWVRYKTPLYWIEE